MTGAWPDLFRTIKTGGYHGIEAVTPPVDQERTFVDLLQQHDLEWIQVAQTNGPTVAGHLDELRRQCEIAKRLSARFVSAQAGRDGFTQRESVEFFAGALRIEEELGIAIAHETHRSRPLFNPWTTADVLAELPSLKLTCDLSHWVCVCERLLEDSLEIVRRAAEQTFHVHARVGYGEGPQVPDPRSPVYAQELAAHEQWWNWMWESQRRRGFVESTLCPEFGPPPYQQTNPTTGQPAASLSEIVDWQANRQRERFELL